MGLDSVVSKCTISTGNYDPRFTTWCQAQVCDYLGLDEWIPINGIRQRGYRDIRYPRIFPRVVGWLMDPRVFGVSHDVC